MINYRSIASLNKDIFAWLQKLPQDIEVIVGVPRSGLLAANLLSLHMNISLTDVEGLLEGRVMEAGPRYMLYDATQLLSSGRKVLVVDDSVLTGTQMRAVKAEIQNARIAHEILYGAVYVQPGSQNVVDYFYEFVPSPRFFEWNVFHHTCMDTFCVDIDGVLCKDPTEKENDDGEMYEHFIRSVQPNVIPTRTIGWLVTCRLEKYRCLTEGWLARHAIKYKHLIMMDFPDKKARVQSNSHAVYKARVYRHTNALLFIESSSAQAAEIAKRAGREVLCMQTRELVSPDFVSRNYHRPRRFAKLFFDDPKKALRAVKRSLCLR